MRVLIYDPLHLGHHLNAVRLLVVACHGLGHDVTFATTKAAADSPEFQQHLSDVVDRFELDAAVEPPEKGPEFLEGFKIAARVWNGLASAIRRSRPQHVILPFGDNVLRAPLALPPWKLKTGLPASAIDVVVLTGAFGYGAELPLKRRLRASLELYGLARLPVGRLLFFDPIPHQWIECHAPKLARRSILCPDPVTPVRQHDKAAARAELGISLDGRLISCVGVLDSRKGIDDFIRAFASASLRPDDRLLLAGKAKPEVHDALRQVANRVDASRLISLDRILSDRELELAISAADVVAVTHRFPAHLGSASILIRAVGADRPVLASEKGWPGYVTRTYQLGWIYPENESNRARAIETALAESETFHLGEKARQFADFHSMKSFAELVTRPLQLKASPIPGG